MFSIPGWLSRIIDRPSQPTTATALRPTQDGLDISPLKGKPTSLFMSWAEVVSAVAFKRDQYVVDRICIVFVLIESRTLEINEEMLGWDRVVEELPAFLPGAAPFAEWFGDVAFPAFKTNQKTIFSRVAA